MRQYLKMRGTLVESSKVRIKGVFDPRGGWNRYKFRTDFFKKWSDEMAYVLGFLYADGDIEDADSSSRTRYVTFSSKDKEIIKKIKVVLESEHPIHFRPPQTKLYPNGKFYTNSGEFLLRIGSKRMFLDLLKLGLVPVKSKVIKFPTITFPYLGHFIRGYFDGDGTIYIKKQKGKEQKTIFKRAIIVFTSGSKLFLKVLSKILAEILKIRNAKVYNGNRCFQIGYSTKESIKIFKLMYTTSCDLFLKRKFKIFAKFFNMRINWIDKDVAAILKKNKKYLAT